MGDYEVETHDLGQARRLADDLAVFWYRNNVAFWPPAAPPAKSSPTRATPTPLASSEASDERCRLLLILRLLRFNCTLKTWQDATSFAQKNLSN